MPSRCAAASARSAPTAPGAGRRAGGARIPTRSPPCSTRCARGPATPTSSTTCCSRSWPPGPLRRGPTCFDALVPPAGRASSTDAGWRPSGRDAAASLATDDEAAAACVVGHLELAGPVSVESWSPRRRCPPGRPLGAPLTAARARTALARLEAKGSAIELPDGRWCARHLLVRLHGASRSRRRGRVEPVPIAEFVRFLAHWQHATPDTRSRDAPGCSRWSSSWPGSRRRRRSGRRTSCRPG